MQNNSREEIETRMKQISFKTAGILSGILYLLSLLPIIRIGFYNYPSADDFMMGIPAKEAYLSGGLMPAVRDGLQYAFDIYMHWMGYFTSNVVMSFPPNIFGERCYVWTTVILLALLTLSTAFFFRVLFVRICGAGRDAANVITMLVLLAGVQCMPEGTPRVEAFFWYSGAINYLGTFSLGLFYLGLMLSAAGSDRKGIRTLDYILLLLVSFWAGGSNYMTALTCVFITTVFLVLMTPAGYRKLCDLTGVCLYGGAAEGSRRGKMILPGLMIAAGFLCCCFAPGNATRDSMVEGFGAVKSILISLYYALTYCVNLWTRWEVIVILLLMTPFLWSLAGESRLSFRYPAAVSLLLYGITAMNFTPPLFALGNIEAGRFRSIMWLQYLYAMALILFYWIGWTQRYVLKRGAGEKEAGGPRHLSAAACKLTGTLIIVLLAGSALCVKATPDYYTATSALTDLMNGTAKGFAEENAVREQILHDPAVRDAVLSEHRFQPELLFFEDITEDPDDWINAGIARYYHKDSITMQKIQ